MSGFKFSAGLLGSKISLVGKDGDVFNFTDLQTAIDSAQNADVIYIEPGTYTQTAILNIQKPISLVGLGGVGDVIITSALTTRTAMINLPATGNAAAQTFKFRNIKFANSSTGDALEIDNDGGLAQSLILDFQFCSFVSTSGVAIDLDQTTTSLDIFVKIVGNKYLNSLGASTLSPDKAGSVISISGMDIGVLTLGNAAKAYVLNVSDCSYYSQAETTGGGSGALLNYINNTYYTAAGQSTAATSGVAGDFDATGTEYWASTSAA